MSGNELNQPTKCYKPEGDPVTVYQKAKLEWDHRYGSWIVQARNWRLAALGSIVVSVCLTIGLVYQSSKSSVTPYVVRVNNDGIAQAIGPAKAMNYSPKETEIRYFLSQIVQKTRAIPTDPIVAKQNWLTVYNFLRQGAASKMNRYVQAENPLAKVGLETVQVEINVIVPLSKNSYQIRWREDIFTKEGALGETKRMTGVFAIELATPKTEKELLVNPLGIYVKDFSWSKEL
jgi:type IV secretory pathway TrbF-like protein